MDFELQRNAMERATALLVDIVGGDVGPIIEELSTEQLPHLPSIQLRRDRINRVLGCDIPDMEVEDIMGRLGMDIVSTESG